MVSRFMIFVFFAIFLVALAATAIRAPILHGARPADAPTNHPLETAELLLDPVAYARSRAWAALKSGRPHAAEDWAAEALSAAPQDAYAALALAWSLIGQGRQAEARATLELTYALAPKSMVLAQSRVALAQAWWTHMDEIERARLLEEVRVARAVDAHAFNQIAERTPRLGALHRLASRVVAEQASDAGSAGSDR